MKRTILVTIFILTLITLTGCKVQEEELKLSADKVDVIPDMGVSECLAQIKQTNPEMSDQAANDNCNAIEAVNKEDKSLCDKIVNRNIKSACLNQFE
jgi:hypothetical protein